MVDERIEDGKRIAELLASEVTGRESGPLAEMAVTEADPDVEPTPDGAFAYAVTRRDARLAAVAVQPAQARLTVHAGTATAVEVAAEATGLTVESDGADDGPARIAVESGAAAKAAVDALVAAAETRDADG
jgi:hypothetical protein